ncbi:hypothetical protein RRG08_007135 [Elysia crispata]|uniref:Uncharacterized protein n=1 Tax=Elysia crispata TaxID=231223 RepID=A0AAE1CTZ7_9GAST|nr:hypothetical protein RRG08_007135 [Elysia crispata]
MQAAPEPYGLREQLPRPYVRKKRLAYMHNYPNSLCADNAQSTSSTNLSNSTPAEIINNTTQPTVSSNSTQVIKVTKERSSEPARNERKQLRTSGQACMTSRGGKGQPVCKKLYLATLGNKQDVVFGAIRKLTDTGAVIADMRGTHKNHLTLDENIVQDIRDHIKSLSNVPSHYCRKSSSKQYLKDDLSLAAIYRLYKELCDKMGISSAK